MTSHRIGVNLRVSGNCDQGGRKYMEDYHAIKFVKKDDRDYEFAYFGIFDGHGGPEASRFARDNLLNEITKYDQFWTDTDEDVLFAIRSGFLDTHQAMWKELDKWPRTVSGLPSTSGTTASIAIIKKSKLYIGHVGDSGIVLGCDEGPCNAIFMKPKCLTKDHKPDNPEEKERIEKSGGSVVAKAGVQRVVWSRPKVNHKGPIRRSTQIDKIPFLAVARSLGDLWSYDYYKGQFVVSPDPDISVMKVEPGRHRCLILGSDGLWNMLSPAEAVSVVTDLEMHFEDRVIHDPMVSVSYWINPAEKLVTRALNKWRAKLMKADNISCIVVLIDPLGPSKLTILRKRREDHFHKLHEAKVVASAVRSSDFSSTTSSPSTSTNLLKANHNQNNLSSREKRGDWKGIDSEVKDGKGNLENKDNNKDTENKTKKFVEDMDSASSASHRSENGFGCNNSFTGRDIITNHTSGHSLRSSSRSPEVSSQASSKAILTAKVGRSLKVPHQSASAVRHPLLPRRFSHPALPVQTDEMDDSVQASSALAVSSHFTRTLPPTSEDALFSSPNPGTSSGGSTHNKLTSSMSVSESLLQLMKLDAVRTSSDPLPKTKTVLSHSCMAGKGIREAGYREQRSQRRSIHGVLNNSHVQFQSSLLTSSPEVSQTLLPKSHITVNKSFHSTCSLNSIHTTRILNKTIPSSRILRIASSQRSSKLDKPLTNSEPSMLKTETKTSSRSLRVAGLIQNASLTSLKKTKRRRGFGLLHRTRTTLRRARKAARKALCPENRPFFKQLPASKRKRDGKETAQDTLLAKRLRRSDGLRYSV